MAQNWTAGIVDGFKQAHAQGQQIWSSMSSGAVRSGEAVQTYIVQPLNQAGGIVQEIGNNLGRIFFTNEVISHSPILLKNT